VYASMYDIPNPELNFMVNFVAFMLIPEVPALPKLFVFLFTQPKL